MIRRCVFLVLVVGAAVVVAPHSAPAREGDPTCGTGSWTAGTVDLCAGELVYRDYVYDDHGATLSDSIAGRLEGLYYYRPSGDGYGDIGTAGFADQYAPAGQLPQSRDNLADLIALRLRVAGDRLHISAELNTLFSADQTTVVVGIDTDDDPATQAGASWPGDLIASPFRLPGQQVLVNHGNDVFVTLTGGDPGTNRLTATVDRPAGRRWRIQTVTARAVAGVRGPVVMNVGFRGVDERGGWWDTAQALALAANDISAMATTVDVADLEGRVTRRALVPPGSTRQRVYVSRHVPGIGEGIDHDGVPGPDGDHGFTLLGRYQPYGFYQPPGHGPFELQLTLHGLGENHAFLLTDPANGRNPTSYARRFGEANDRILASPLARGPEGWYSSYAERDVLDVLADVQAHHPVDADRVFLGGLSMGGYGTMRLASLHPDTFAAAVEWVGPTGASNTERAASAGSDDPGQRANVLDLLGNLRNTPLAALYHGTDQLVHADQALAVRDRLADLQVPSVHWFHPVGPHSSDANFDDWSKEAAWSAGRTRTQNPARVTFRTAQRFIHPELGITPNRAYWITHIVPAGPGYADVDARSHACDPEPVLETTTGAGTGPSPWVSQDIHPAGTVRRPPANRVDLTMRNVEALTIDLTDACLDPTDLELHTDADRPVTLSFAGAGTLEVPAGAHVLTVGATGAPMAQTTAVGGAHTTGAAVGATSSTPPGGETATSLPSTGAGATGPVALALLAAALLLRRMRPNEASPSSARR